MFNVKDIEQFCNFAESILKRGGQEHIFCFAEQIAFWGRGFHTRMKNIEDSVTGTAVFKVKKAPLSFSHSSGSYL